MIKKFHVLYVGQIELDNVGLDGTPANERRYSDEWLREGFFTARDVAQLMDDLVSTSFGRPSIISSAKATSIFPNLIQLGLWLATQTQRLNSVAASTCCRCGTRSGWRKITPWPTSSPTAASSWGWDAAITPARWKVRRAAPRRRQEPRVFRGAAAAAAGLLQRAVVPLQGQIFRGAAAGGLSRL